MTKEEIAAVRESLVAVLVRHAEWCLDQADPEVVRDLPATRRQHMRGVVRKAAGALWQMGARVDSIRAMARLAELEGRT
ncbi:MAG: hypothetical protein ACRCSL_16705 [Microbacterium sp.]